MAFKKKIVFVAFLALFSLGCERFYFENGENIPQSQIFEEAWTFTKQEYSYFELKGVNWDDVKQKYLPQINDQMSNDSLFNVIGKMLDELKDGHNNLSSPFNRSRSWDWFLDFPENYDATIIEREYFKGKQRYMDGLIYLDLDSIGYVSYRSFSNEIEDENLELLSKLIVDKKGVIIDVRNNGGGSLTNAYKLASLFTDVDYFAGFDRFKIGPGANDFSDWQRVQVSNYEGIEPPFTGKVAVLINRKSYSATSFFSMFMQARPNCMLIGDQTGGGGGAPSFTELSNGWLLRVSATQTQDNDSYDIELGVKPDIFLNMTQSSINQGKDDIIERALIELSK